MASHDQLPDLPAKDTAKEDQEESHPPALQAPLLKGLPSAFVGRTEWCLRRHRVSLQHLQQLSRSNSDILLPTRRSGRTTRYALPTYKGEVAVPDLKIVSKYCIRGVDVWTKRIVLLELKLLQSEPAAYRALCRAKSSTYGDQSH